MKAAVWGRSGGTRSTPPSRLPTIKRSICLYGNIRDVLLGKGVHVGLPSCMGAFKIYMRCSSGRQQRPPPGVFFPSRGVETRRAHIKPSDEAPPGATGATLKEIPFKGPGRLQFFRFPLGSFLFCCICCQRTRFYIAERSSEQVLSFY